MDIKIKYMKKIIFVSLILGSFLWEGCDDNSFDYQMYQPGLNDIDSVYFSTGAPMMIDRRHSILL